MSLVHHFDALQRERHRMDSVSTLDRDRLACLRRHGLGLTAIVDRLAGKGVTPAVAAEVLILVLGIANVLNVDLRKAGIIGTPGATKTYLFRPLADANGRLADAIEKIDYPEAFHAKAVEACQDLAGWALVTERCLKVDLAEMAIEQMQAVPA